MASKTNSDSIRDLEREVAKLIERTDNDQRTFARLEDLIARITDDRDDLRTRVALLEAKQAALKAAQDEKDRRRWTIWVAVVGSVLALIGNVAMILFKR